MTVQRRNRWGFGLGTLGRDMTAALVTMYLMFYLTDIVGLDDRSLAVVTAIIVALRLFDALNDPIMGWIVDNTHSRWGKFKPWIAVGAVLWAASTVALFLDFRLSRTAFLVVFGLLYLVWGVSYTINDISFYGMLPSLSRDPKEREGIGVVARITANVGLFAVVVGVLPLTSVLGDHVGDPRAGWLSFAVIVVVIMLGFQSLTLFFTVEEVQVAPQRTPLRELIGVIIRNDQLLWVTLGMLTFMAGYLTTTSLGVYYFKYIYGDEGQYPVFAAVLGVAQLTGLALFPLVAKRLRRSQIHTLATVLCMVGLTVFAVAGSAMPVIIVAGLSLFIGQAFIQVLLLLYVADCVEYGQWKSGRRNESVTFALQPFIYKSSGAIGSGMVGLALLLSGINNAASAADVTPTGQWVFRAVMMGVPLVLTVASWWLLQRRYRIDEPTYARIVADLSDRIGHHDSRHS